jgi:hypothetical protein
MWERFFSADGKSRTKVDFGWPAADGRWGSPPPRTAVVRRPWSTWAVARGER